MSYKEGQTSTLTVYYENGKVKKAGKYVLSKSDGLFIVYFENGKIKQEHFYEKWKVIEKTGHRQLI